MYHVTAVVVFVAVVTAVVIAITFITAFVHMVVVVCYPHIQQGDINIIHQPPAHPSADLLGDTALPLLR